MPTSDAIGTSCMLHKSWFDVVMYECMTPCVGERQHGSMYCRLKKCFSHRDLCNERLGSISYMHRAALGNGTTILEAYTGRGEAPCAKPLAPCAWALYCYSLLLTTYCTGGPRARQPRLDTRGRRSETRKDRRRARNSRYGVCCLSLYLCTLYFRLSLRSRRRL